MMVPLTAHLTILYYTPKCYPISNSDGLPSSTILQNSHQTVKFMVPHLWFHFTVDGHCLELTSIYLPVCLIVVCVTYMNIILTWM